ncbi:MAG: hypothetical protein RL227_2272, partial [Pseudomonadota bacterium]
MTAVPALALFDLDGTLLPRDSDHAFGEFLVQRGWVSDDAFRRANDRFYADYLEGRLDMTTYVDFATAAWRDRPEAEQQRVLAAFVDEIVRPMLHPAAVDVVERHRQAGEPGLHTHDLALAERWRAGDAAGHPARVIAFQLGGDQRVDAEQRRDRPCHELVGGGDQGQAIAGLAVALHHVDRSRVQHRAHDLVDEGGQHALLL